MSKSKKAVKYIFLAFLAVLVTILAVNFIIDFVVHDNKWAYEQTFETTLPEKLHEDYYASSERNFHNDGVKYSVYTPKEEIPSDFFADFSDGCNPEYKEEISSWLDEIDVPSENRPNFENQCRVKLIKKYEEYSDKMYLLYDQTTNKLYVVVWRL